MKTSVYLSGIEPSCVDPALIADLVAIYPAGEEIVRGERRFACHALDPDDPALARLVERIEAAGYRFAIESYRKPGYVSMVIVRAYEEGDLDGVALFQLRAELESYVSTYYRDGQGRIRINARELPRKADFVSDLAQSEFFVPTRIKAVLEASGLEGLAFIEAAPVGRDFHGPVRWKKAGEELWELTSPIRMPPVSPRMDCRDDRGNPVNSAEFGGQVLFYDGLVRPVELRYTADSMRAMPPFDLARLHERWTASPEGDAVLIASARFRDVCREHGWKVDWVPVRIDD